MVEVGSETPDGDGPIMFILEASNFDVMSEDHPRQLYADVKALT